MDKTSKKILKYISKQTNSNQKQILSSQIKAHFSRIPAATVSQAIAYLETEEYISIFRNYHAQPIEMHISLTYKGKTFFEAEHKQDFRFWFPVTISVIALIGGYRQEISLLLQAIMQLLK